MEKKEFKALVEQYKNEMIELFNLKKDDEIEQTAENNIMDENSIEENKDSIDDAENMKEDIEEN